MAKTATSPKKVKTTSVKKVNQHARAHPPVKQLVVGAVKALKERKGSSLLAIKKYIKLNAKLDSEKLSPYIKKFLRKAVANGLLVQTKGKGAAGSFKLPTKENKAKKLKAQKSGFSKKSKKTVVSKVQTPKKNPTKKTASPTKKSKTPKKVAVKKPKTLKKHILKKTTKKN
ncbi:histone H1B, sperm-like [Culicoides brevitarsis]|uniref:histone H1B, sperm-like n=1 Tax=Culicoides brevitarsis TaxID=469753 RepID=UPI00307C7A0C